MKKYQLKKTLEALDLTPTFLFNKTQALRVKYQNQNC